MGLRTWFNRVILKKEVVTVRARGTAGKFKADDPATKDTNEAYTTVYKPKKKVAKKKTKAKKKKK